MPRRAVFIRARLQPCQSGQTVTYREQRERQREGNGFSHAISDNSHDKARRKKRPRAEARFDLAHSHGADMGAAESRFSVKPITRANFQEPSGWRLITLKTLPRIGLVFADCLNEK